MNQPADIKILKPSELTQAALGVFSLLQLRVLDIMLYECRRAQSASCVLPVTHLRHLCKYTQDISTLKEHMASFVDTPVRVNLLNKEKSSASCATTMLSFASVEYVGGQYFVKYTLSNYVAGIVLSPTQYSVYSFDMMLKFTSKYAYVLYQMIKDYKTYQPEIKMETLRALLGADDKYPSFREFRRCILDHAIQQINELSDITCDYVKSRGYSRSVSYIRFKMRHKPGTTTNHIQEHMLPDYVEFLLPANVERNKIQKIISRYLHREDAKHYIYVNLDYTVRHYKQNFYGFFMNALVEDLGDAWDYPDHVRYTNHKNIS
jgi:hypothetical protein